MFHRAMAPIPNRNPKDMPKGTCKYPFNDIEVGESFFVPIKTGVPGDLPNATTIQNMRTHISRHNKDIASTKGKRFKCAVYPDNKAYIQIWRLS